MSVPTLSFNFQNRTTGSQSCEHLGMASHCENLFYEWGWGRYVSYTRVIAAKLKGKIRRGETDHEDMGVMLSRMDGGH